MITTDPIDLEALVQLELPALPDVAMRVAALTQDLNTSTSTIAAAIGHDPILGARVLRAANSPLYYLERTVTTLTMAVNAIGNEGINLLVVASAASDTFQTKGKRPQSETALWKHSLAVGLATREIMSLLGLRGMEEGFICGLLHDIGKLLLFRHDLEACQQLVKNVKQKDFLAAEADLFGYTHAQVGALVAKRWNLPDSICHAIYHHHHPIETQKSALMARIIEVADALTNNAGVGVWPVAERSLENTESAIELRLSDHQLKDVWKKTESALSATFALFN